MAPEREFELVADNGFDKLPEGTKIVPIKILYGEDDITDGGSSLLLSKIKENKGKIIYPKTQAPSPGDFLTVYKEIYPREMISMHIGSEISGTYNSADIAASEMEGKVHLFDTETVSLAAGFFAMKASEMTGKTADQVVAELEKMKKRVVMFATFDTTDYLEKGGRGKEVFKSITNKTNMKLVVKIEGNKIKFDRLAMGRHGALKTIGNKVKKLMPIEQIGIVHADAEKDAQKMANLLSKFCEPDLIKIIPIGPVMLTHGGPKALGVAILRAAA